MPSNFIDAYLHHTRDYESPTSFWRWSAYSAIAAVLRDNVFRRQGDSAIYPSNFILFLARSSYDRKNRPVELCEQLVTKVANTKVIAGRASIQGIMTELGRTETNRSTGRIVKGGAAIFFAPELGASIVEDPAAVKCLTDIYDFKPNAFNSFLRTQPNFKIDKIVLSMLSASNAEMIKDLYTQVAVTGGLLARTMLVVPDEFRKGNSLLDTPDQSEGFDCLVKLLTQISTLQGELEVTKDAKKYYNDWYLPFRESYRDKSEKTGILGRIHSHIFKLAIVLMANDMTMTMEKKHIEQAKDECLGLLGNYKLFSVGSGKSTQSDAAAVVLQELLRVTTHKLSVKVLLQNNMLNNFDLELLEKTTNTLEAGGLITRMLEGNTMSLQLTAKALEILGEKPKGKEVVQ